MANAVGITVMNWTRLIFSGISAIIINMLKIIVIKYFDLRFSMTLSEMKIRHKYPIFPIKNPILYMIK